MVLQMTLVEWWALIPWEKGGKGIISILET